jgi:hypothetical protein
MVEHGWHVRNARGRLIRIFSLAQVAALDLGAGIAGSGLGESRSVVIDRDFKKRSVRRARDRVLGDLLRRTPSGTDAPDRDSYYT